MSLSSSVESIRRTAGIRKEWFGVGRVLDIGCGGRCRGTLGVDIAPTPAADVLADGRRLPFEPGAFDAVVCYHVVEHLPVADIDGLFAEMARVLAPDGRAHVLVDRDMDRDRLLAKDPTHVERYAPTKVRDLASRHLDIEVFQTHNLVGNMVQHPLTWWRYLDRGTKIYVEGRPA